MFIDVTLAPCEAPLWRENDGPACAQWLLVTPKSFWFTLLAA